ncbi:MAG: hypothetical protein ACTSSE_12135 [Candidatus Thorarchaeota archaeon]
MDIEGVVIFEAASGVPLYSKMKGNTDPSLFSSFVSAIGHFSKEMRFGGLSSFTTEEKVIYLAPRDKTITALISPKRKEYQEAYSLASELGRRFEDGRNITTMPSTEDYDDFEAIADEFLKRIKNPFVSNVSSFVHDIYGGEVSIEARLFKRDGGQGVIDVLIDTSSKKNGGNGGSLFGENYIFVKATEGVLGRVQLIDFIDSLDRFGVRFMNKDEFVFRPYFPSRAVIVARNFDQGALQFLEKYTHKNQTYIDGAHIYAGLKLKDIPKETRCFVDLWQWRDDALPEKIQV